MARNSGYHAESGRYVESHHLDKSRNEDLSRILVLPPGSIDARLREMSTNEK